MSKSRVKWTEDEELLIAQELYLILSQNPRLGCIEAARKAQENLITSGGLSELRRRTIFTVANIEGVIVKLKEIYEDYINYKNKYKEIKSRITTTPNLTKEDIINTLNDEEIKEKFLPRLLDIVSPEEVISLFSADNLLYLVPTSDLFGYAAKRFVEDMMDKEVKLTQTVIHQMQEKTSGDFKFKPPISTSTKRKRKVAIIGAQPQQFNRFRDECQDSLECLFVDKGSLCQKPIPTVDFVVSWVNHVSHAQQRIVNEQSKKIGISPEMVFGGTKQISSKLQELSGKN